jgi:hypothetical protein
VIPTRATTFIVVISTTVAITFGAAAQQAAQPAAPTQKVEPEKPVAKSAKRIRVSRAKHGKFRYASRSYDPGSPADICRVMNGWRAFRNRYDPYGYFYDGHVKCYR